MYWSFCPLFFDFGRDFNRWLRVNFWICFLVTDIRHWIIVLSWIAFKEKSNMGRWINFQICSRDVNWYWVWLAQFEIQMQSINNFHFGKKRLSETRKKTWLPFYGTLTKVHNTMGGIKKCGGVSHSWPERAPNPSNSSVSDEIPRARGFALIFD